VSKYLDRLKAVLGEKGLPKELTKPTEPSFVSFGSGHTRPFPDFSPPLDTGGVPCGGCPSCGKGEFWRWPKFHRAFNLRGWQCWFCTPPPPDSGPLDFCGVPESVFDPLGRPHDE
jgi:hypothetical protein